MFYPLSLGVTCDTATDNWTMRWLVLSWNCPLFGLQFCWISANCLVQKMTGCFDASRWILPEIPLCQLQLLSNTNHLQLTILFLILHTIKNITLRWSHQLSGSLLIKVSRHNQIICFILNYKWPHQKLKDLQFLFVSVLSKYDWCTAPYKSKVYRTMIQHTYIYLQNDYHKFSWCSSPHKYL